ncbi:MAG: pyridoxal phosphate-dependent aminotransferase [Bacteroidaceae bacterium]|nr:pyridoxal phosphate-dependent aminotransferase [Bacteroidaceae bacterium]
MKIFSEELVAKTAEELHITNIENATIGETLILAQTLEQRTGIPFIRMDQGSPGLPANMIGRQAEKDAIDRGVGQHYPAAAGIPELKNATEKFVKAFLDIDIPAACCLPTTGSVAASFGAFVITTQLDPKKNKVLFIDPGFPIQKSQLRIIGAQWEEFDIHDHRGDKLQAKIEPILAKGDIAAIVYSNPNNPAWICLEEDELQTIGSLATKYDVIVLEDLAYFCMDYRRQLGHPFEPPYPPTVARYTDNYILMLSSSKIFSYAGQRAAVACVSPKLFDRHYPALASRYHDAGHFGTTFIASVMYMITSGVTHSTQFGMAAMYEAAVKGEIDFVEDTREYQTRAKRMLDIFKKHGFTMPYESDPTQGPVEGGFFFTLGYPGMKGGELMKELIHYGVSAISLSTTGSEQQGIRGCTSRMREELYSVLDERMAAFAQDHKADSAQ